MFPLITSVVVSPSHFLFCAFVLSSLLLLIMIASNLFFLKEAVLEFIYHLKNC